MWVVAGGVAPWSAACRSAQRRGAAPTRRLPPGPGPAACDGGWRDGRAWRCRGPASFCWPHG
jgi:hypothetical protein